MGTVFDNSVEEEDEQRCGGSVAKVEAEKWSWREMKLRAHGTETQRTIIREAHLLQLMAPLWR